MTSGRATSLRRLNDRLPDWSVAIGVGLVTAVIASIAQWRGTLFFYVGDQHEQFAPMWHMFGDSLRDRQWPPMDPAGWMGGNYAAEGLDGIWNPLNWANFLLVSRFDNLSLASYAVMVEILAILAAGVYLLAREYGARRFAAIVVAVALPVSGFTLWYEASGWPAGLMAFTWVTHFWWASRRFSRGATNPLVPFLFGFLALTTGNPYATLGVLVVLAAVGIELLVARGYGRLLHLVVMGACVGAIALLVFLPLLGSSEVTTRDQLAAIANDTFLVPDIGDLVAGSSPTYLPSMSTWADGRLEAIPTTYLAWFVLPLLPWIRWRSLRARTVGSISVFIVGGVYLFATLAPSNLWLFRWPVRLVEYLYLAGGVLFALALSAGLAADHVRRRAIATSAIVAAGAYLAWAVRPDQTPAHLLGLLLTAALVAALLIGYRRAGSAALTAVAVIGTAAVLFLQTSLFPAAAPKPVGTPPGPATAAPAYDLSRIETGTADYRGTVLQLAALDRTGPEDARNGEILFGNLPRAAGVESIASYTGMGFAEFADELCMDYRGATCKDAYERLWQPADAQTPAPLIDVMGVSTLVLQRALLPDAAAGDPPPGWHVAYDTPVRVVWVRDEVLPEAGRMTWASPGIVATTESSAPGREEIRFTADEAGRMVFARLAWPGYTATVDGSPVELSDGPAGLLAVDVPAGDHTLVVEYATPGLKAGAVAAAAALVIVLLQTAVWFGQRRSRFARRGTPVSS
ncbi:hypothetical protein C8K36_108256 [Rhodococcus sp. OK519]|uniref:hypothetical protein n=1 Tax=Rhodococcus sp. OK519 TaxID=2135729 RepID=UPI000D362A47|nr:hypothetical protein C8K36_108256 [Rhodococcus sp. OK519]